MMPSVKWERCGSDDLIGAIVTYVDYNGEVQAENDTYKFRTQIEQDWGYCYCYDGSDDSRCSCTPSMVSYTERTPK